MYAGYKIFSEANSFPLLKLISKTATRRRTYYAYKAVYVVSSVRYGRMGVELYNDLLCCTLAGSIS